MTRLAPPRLTHPITIDIPNPVTSSFPTLTAGQDYILRLPTAAPLHVNATASSAIPINGGRNVVVIGGEIEFIDHGLLPTENAGNGTTTQCGRVCIVQNNTGTVHLEGIWAHGYGFVEAPNVYSDLTTLQLQSCRFGDTANPAQNRQIGALGSPVSGDHPDSIAFLERCAAAKFDSIDSWTGYQGFFLANAVGEVHPSRVDMSNIGLHCQDVTGLVANCTSWASDNSTAGTLRDMMAAWSAQTTAQTQTHSGHYGSSASWCAALATYKCDAPPTFVQSLGSTTDLTNNTTISKATTATVASGSTIFAVIGHRGLGLTISSVTGGGLTWVVDKDVHDDPNFFGVAIARAYAPSGLASGTTITVTLSAANPTKKLFLGEFSGVSSSSPLDKTSSGVVDSNFVQAFTVPLTAATSQNQELVISAWMAGFSSGGTLTPGSGATPTTAQQVLWQQQDATHGNAPVYLTNVYVEPVGTASVGLHIWPDTTYSDATLRPTLSGGKWSWPSATGWHGSVTPSAPPADFTLPGGTAGGPGRNYRPAAHHGATGLRAAAGTATGIRSPTGATGKRKHEIIGDNGTREAG